MMSALKYVNVHIRLKQHGIKVKDSGTNIIDGDKVETIKQLRKWSRSKKKREKQKKLIAFNK